MNYKYIVKEAGIRLDKYLSENNEDLSRAMLQKLIDSGNVLVNSEMVKASYKVCVGDIIEVFVEEPKESKLKSEEIPLNIHADIIPTDCRQSRPAPPFPKVHGNIRSSPANPP